MNASLALDGTVTALLLWIAREDSFRFRISNRLLLVLAMAWPVALLLEGRFDLLIPHGLFALAALAVLVGGFCTGICGGGDAKLLATALLWIGPEGTLVFAALLLPAVFVYAAGARFGQLPALHDGRRLRIPLGPCIAFAWIGVIVLSRLMA